MSKNKVQSQQKIKNIGLMLTKNEEPILKDTLDWNIQFVDELFVLDGGESDQAYNIMKSYPQLKWYMHERELEGKFKKPIRDGIRQYVLKQIIDLGHAGNWVTLMHGDELFYHDPRQAIAFAESTEANCVKWFSPHFFPHSTDELSWAQNENLPVRERITWYAHNYLGCWIEDRQFKLLDGMHYRLQQHRNVLPVSPKKYKPLRGFPIFHHFKVWNLDPNAYTEIQQKRNGLRARGKFGVIPYFPDKHSEFFVNQLPGYPCASLYDGGFGKLERSFEKMKMFCSAEPSGLNYLFFKIGLAGNYGFLILEKAFLRRYFDLKKRLESMEN